MPTPADCARTIIDWVGVRPLAGIAPDLAALPDGHALLRAADAIADAADSDDEATRSAGLGALFGGLVEPLNDGFTPAGRAAYARFSPAKPRCSPGMRAYAVVQGSCRRTSAASWCSAG